MRHTRPRPITGSTFLVAVLGAALVLPACGKKTKEDATASSSKGSTPAGSSGTKGSDGSGGTTKAPPKPPGPAPTEPTPTTDPAPAPAPPADAIEVKVEHADSAQGPFVIQLGKWSVVQASFDPANLEGATAKLEIDLASLSSGLEWRDIKLRSTDYFDVAKFPTVTVSVDNVKKSGDARYTADASVNMHGVEKKKNITMDVVASAADRVTVKVSQPLSRLEFNIGSSVEQKNPYAHEVVVEAVVTLKKP